MVNEKYNEREANLKLSKKMIKALKDLAKISLCYNYGMLKYQGEVIFEASKKTNAKEEAILGKISNSLSKVRSGIDKFYNSLDKSVENLEEKDFTDLCKSIMSPTYDLLISLNQDSQELDALMRSLKPSGHVQNDDDLTSDLSLDATDFNNIEFLKSMYPKMTICKYDSNVLESYGVPSLNDVYGQDEVGKQFLQYMGYSFEYSMYCGDMINLHKKPIIIHSVDANDKDATVIPIVDGDGIISQILMILPSLRLKWKNTGKDADSAEMVAYKIEAIKRAYQDAYTIFKFMRDCRPLSWWLSGRKEFLEEDVCEKPVATDGTKKKAKLLNVQE